LAGDLPCKASEKPVKEELAISAADISTPLVLWALLAGELVIASCLLLSDRLPSALVRSLQLFLRF
jgi:hypothetical protein